MSTFITEINAEAKSKVNSQIIDLFVCILHRIDTFNTNKTIETHVYVYGLRTRLTIEL